MNIQNDIRTLIKLYEENAGADDVAGQKIQDLGIRGRDEMIKMLEDSKTEKDDAGAIIEILHVYFPSKESYDAMERFASKISDPKEREVYQKIIPLMQQSDPRKK